MFRLYSIPGFSRANVAVKYKFMFFFIYMYLRQELSTSGRRLTKRFFSFSVARLHRPAENVSETLLWSDISYISSRKWATFIFRFETFNLMLMLFRTQVFHLHSGAPLHHILPHLWRCREGMSCQLHCTSEPGGSSLKLVELSQTKGSVFIYCNQGGLELLFPYYLVLKILNRYHRYGISLMWCLFRELWETTEYMKYR